MQRLKGGFSVYKVLLVDDEDIVLQGLMRFVNWEEHGFTVAGMSTSVARALTVLESESIDLVITDIQMPIQDGIDLMRILNMEYSTIKSIVLSSHSEFSYAQQAMRLGALDYLTKPVNFKSMKKLLGNLKEMLDKERIIENEQVQELLTRSLIMNLVNGYPYNESRVAAYLNVTCPITVIQIMVFEEVEKMSEVTHELKKRFHPCQIISHKPQELLIVLESSYNPEVLSSELLAFREEYLLGKRLYIGVSEEHTGYFEIRKAVLEASKAMRFQNARNSEDVLLYKQIKLLYTESTDINHKLIPELIELLITPEKRSEFMPTLKVVLQSFEEDSDLLMENVQRFCTELLMEMDAPIQSLLLPDYQSHVQLSNILINVFSQSDVQEISNHITIYFERILDKLTRVDESQMAGELITQVKKYMELHFSEDLTLNILSEQFYINPVYLSRLFKQKANINFIDYLTSLRMNKAKELLSNSHLKVYQIAEMIGYENPRYFARVFKEYSGYTPSEFRNQKIEKESPI